MVQVFFLNALCKSCDHGLHRSPYRGQCEMDALENDRDHLKMQIIFGSPLSGKILNEAPHTLHRWTPREHSRGFLKICLKTWRLWSIGQAQDLRRATRLALYVRLRSLLRSWRSATEHSLKVEIRNKSRAQEMLQNYQQRKKEQYVRTQMKHVRAACLFKIRTVRWTAKVAQFALFLWSMASQISRLASSVSRRESHTSLRKAMTCLKAEARSAYNARFVAQRQCAGLLYQGFLLWQQAVKLKAEEKQHFRNTSNHLRNIRLKRSFQNWCHQLHSLQDERMRGESLINNRRRTILSNAFSFFKSMLSFQQKEQKVTQRFRLSQARRALEALRLHAKRLSQMRAVARSQKRAVARDKLKSWNLLYQSHEKVARLAQSQQHSAQDLLRIWLHGCILVDIFSNWHIAVKFLIKEAQAEAFSQSRLKRVLDSSLRAWQHAASTSEQHRKARLNQFEVSWLGRFARGWQGHVAKLKQVELQRKRQLAHCAKQTLHTWRQNCYVLQRFHMLRVREGLQLCAGAFRLWRMVRRALCLNAAVERRLQTWTMSSWAEWTALRKQARDDVAWQRWADGIVDLFSTRRLLLALPLCFTSWSHFHRFRKAKFILAANKQLQVDRQMAWLGLVAFRRNLAICRFCQIDHLLEKAQRSHMLQMLLRFRKACKISSTCQIVTTSHHRVCKHREPLLQTNSLREMSLVRGFLMVQSIAKG